MESMKNQSMEYARLEHQVPSEIYSRKQFSCGICQSVFSNGAKVWQHREKSHQLELPVPEPSSIEEGSIECANNRFQCDFCEKSFASKSNKQRHIKAIHNILPEQGNGTLKCSECLCAFLSHSSFIEHFYSSHPDIDIRKESLTFLSEADFDLWKNKIERETTASYTIRKRNKNKNGTTVMYYNCHRNGNFISESNNQRHLKRGSSCKINSYCPARIKVQSQLNIKGKEIINVEYYSKHVGHKCDISYLRIPRDEKDKIATKISDRVPMQEIILSTGSTSPSKRLSVTTMQDLRNIASTYGINDNIVRNNDDIISVDSWVSEMRNSDYDPILLFKPIMEINNNFPGIKPDDFILGFMNEAQEEIFKIYGNDIISIDSTHGTNKYNIQLTSIVVKDDYYEGFPVAFLWSNRQTEEVFQYFFEAIKEKIGSIQAKTFMSDDYPAFYNALAGVFSSCQFILICDWHIKKNWNKHSISGPNQILNLEKREKVLNTIYNGTGNRQIDF